MSVWPIRFRHGNETVEAFRWTGDATQREEPQWAVDALSLGTMRIEQGGRRGGRLLVMTRSDWAIAKPGDWIVRLPSLRMEVCTDADFRRRCAAVPRPVKKTDRRSHDHPGLMTIWSKRKERPLPIH